MTKRGVFSGKSVTRWVLGVAAIAASGPAWGSSTGSGYVTRVLGINNGAVMFFHNGSRSALPTCEVSGETGRWAINATTAAGQALLSMVLSAQAQHLPVTIYGTGECSIAGSSESVSMILVG